MSLHGIHWLYRRDSSGLPHWEQGSVTVWVEFLKMRRIKLFVAASQKENKFSEPTHCYMFVISM